MANANHFIEQEARAFECIKYLPYWLKFLKLPFSMAIFFAKNFLGTYDELGRFIASIKQEIEDYVSMPISNLISI